MNNGLKILYRRVLVLNRIQSAHFPSSQSLTSTVSHPAEVQYSLENDIKLVKKGDFRGVLAKQEKKRLNNPDIVLSKIQESLRKNFRISGDIILIDVIRQLETGNQNLENLLLRSPDRWIPLLISGCGHPLSNIENNVKLEILERLWTILTQKIDKLPTYAWNSKFQVLNEIEADWDPVENLDRMERNGIEPDLETFHHIVEKIARTGNIEGCKNMVYTMATKGFSVDEHINASSIFVFSIRGHDKKADSLIEQASTKYGENGLKLAYGAAVKAAAYRGDNDRLRNMLRKSLNESTKKLKLNTDDIFETIWQMAEKSRDGSGSECSQLIEQMLNCTWRDAGFFRKLYREIERHICHRHYYTALSLLEDTKRVSDCLENQQKNLFLLQLVAKLSAQLVRSQEKVHVIRDVANRVHFAFNTRNFKNRIRMYDDLMFATLTLKEMPLDRRLEYFRTFSDEIDPKRKRIHMTLPLLTSEKDLEQRLAILYRLTIMGYHDWSKIDIDPMIPAILQPIYDSGRPYQKVTKLDKVWRVLKSYGINEKDIWMMIHQWMKRTEKEESMTSSEEWKRPYSRDLKGWCRAYYSETFETPRPTQKSVVMVPYEKLKSCVEQGDFAKVSAILSNSDGCGWPKDTNFEEIVPKVIELYLNHENWKNVKSMISNLSTYSSTWSEDPSKTALQNSHLLMILRRLAEEGSDLSIRTIIDYAYELRNLFPYAICHYDSFFDTQNEYKKLFAKCFERLEKQGLNTATVEELIDFLRCLVKLDIIQLHPTETLTVFFVNTVLRRIGWEEALNTWQKFVSSLHCPNGTVALLRWCLNQNNDAGRKNMQFVIHRGSTFLSQSRIAAMHIAVLIGMRKYEEAEKVCDHYGESKIGGQDCLMAMRLMNSLKARSVDEQFMLDFAAVCLRKLKLAEDGEVVQNMQADLLRICDLKHMGPTALRVYELFAEYGVKLGNDEKSRLATVIEKHAELSKKWMFKPNGFLNLKADDEIITESDEARIEKKLKKEVEA